MIFSMTGFGRGEILNDNANAVVEIKSVNHRYCDVYIRMPRQVSFLEDKIRSEISKRIMRGKVDVFITYENNCDDSKDVQLDTALAKGYRNALLTLSSELNLREEISVVNLARFPEVLKVQKNENEELAWNTIKEAVDQALNNLLNMRQLEGERLKQNILSITDVIKQKVDNVKTRAPFVVDEYKERLNTRLSELLEKNIVDETRIAAEVAIFADKCSIDEEIVRLDSHLVQMNNILNSNGSIGRKLDFLIQEMNREVNTIGSKANDLKITNNVVELKSEIEKIREQIQNIE